MMGPDDKKIGSILLKLKGSSDMDHMKEENAKASEIDGTDIAAKELMQAIKMEDPEALKEVLVSLIEMVVNR